MRTSGMALLCILFAALACPAADIPGPMSGTFVHDFAGVIPDEKKAEIQAKARRLKDEFQTEIAVVTIDSLQGEDSFDYSMRMARSWGIGSKENDVRGLLILVAVKDRKTAFRTSRHIEGELPDGVTGEISRRMNANFKSGDFGGGLSLGLDQILERLKVAYEPQPAALKAPEAETGLGWLWLPLIAVPALGLGYAASRRRSRKGKQAEPAGQAAAKGNFRAWAAAKDPSPVPQADRKSPNVTRAKSRPAKGKQKGHKRSAGDVPHRGSEPSTYSSSSSYDSSSSSYDTSSSSYDSSSSSSSDSSYSGGSDFGGGGSDSSW